MHFNTLYIMDEKFLREILGQILRLRSVKYHVITES